MTTQTPNAMNVISGKAKATGAVFRAPLGTAAPTDALTPLGEAFAGLGYVGNDGLVEMIDRSTEKITAWGGDTVKIVMTEHSVRYKCTLIETGNQDVLKAVFGQTNVTSKPASKTEATLHKILVNSKELEQGSWDFEMADGEKTVRIFVPVGSIVSIGDISYVDDDVIGYEVEIEALPDSTGNKAYKFIDLGDKKSS